MRFYCVSCEQPVQNAEIQLDFILHRYYVEAKCHGDVTKFHIPKYEADQNKKYDLFPPKVTRKNQFLD